MDRLVFIRPPGMLCSFAQICFATRSDFNHAKFPRKKTARSRNRAIPSVRIIVLGMLASFLIGGAVLLIRLLFHPARLERRIYHLFDRRRRVFVRGGARLLLSRPQTR